MHCLEPTSSMFSEGTLDLATEILLISSSCNKCSHIALHIMKYIVYVAILTRWLMLQVHLIMFCNWLFMCGIYGGMYILFVLIFLIQLGQITFCTDIKGQPLTLKETV